MHTLGQELGKQTIAEQIETEEEWACLKRAGLSVAPAGAAASGLTGANGVAQARVQCRVGEHDRGFGVMAVHFVGARFD